MDPSLCANGCGFYGSAENNNLCSKCYQDYLKENIIKSYDKGLKIETKNLKDETLVLESSTSPKPCASNNSINELCVAMTDVFPTELGNMEKKKKRCRNCNKKVGLLGFKCRCGDVFCGRHRYPEEHACKVNFKEIGRQALAKQNPIINSDKLEARI